MDQRRLFLAIAISIGILVAFQMLLGRHLPSPQTSRQAEQTTSQRASPGETPLEGAPATGGAQAASPSAPRNVPRLKIAAPRLKGSISLLGARIDDLVLIDYRET